MSKINILIASAAAIAFTISAFGQTRTVTNADLEKYRIKRVEAERDLSENYKELGFPSPEELDRQNRESRRELAALADRIRQEEREREAQAAAEYQSGGLYDAPVYPYPNPSFVDYGRYYAPGYIYGYYYGKRNYGRSGYHRTRQPQGGLYRFRNYFRTIRRISNGGNRVLQRLPNRRTGRSPGNRRRGN